MLFLLSLGGLAHLASCGQCGGRAGATDAAPVGVDATGDDAARAPGASASDASDASDAFALAPVSADAAVVAPSDAGPSSCRLVWGPAEQPFRGPATLAVTPTELRVVGNEDGKPHVYTVPITPPPKAASAPPSVPDTFASMRWPPCEVGGRFVYCQAKGGAVTRTTLGASDTKEIAKSRAGTRIAAAPLGADHSVVAFLDTRRTSEGETLQAFALLDDAAPTRLSDEGAGANDVHFVPRGEGAVAVYLDQRTGMAPVHARTVSRRGKELGLGPDVVLFISGPPEANIDFSVAHGAGGDFVLMPTSRETTEFGVATIPVGDPLKGDVPVTWSLYPNGLDPAPIAAAGAYVARVRPLDKAPASPRVLELGRLDEKGTFASLGSLGEAPKTLHVAMAADAHGALWILHADPRRTRLERRVCP